MVKLEFRFEHSNIKGFERGKKWEAVDGASAKAEKLLNQMHKTRRMIMLQGR